MTHLAPMLWHSGDEPDLPDSFWVGLQAAWFTAHAETVLQPLLSAGYDVIVDGWLYKFWSKLLIQGYTQRDLDIIFARVRMPDAVVLLTTDINSLFDRRRFRPPNSACTRDTAPWTGNRSWTTSRRVLASCAPSPSSISGRSSTLIWSALRSTPRPGSRR